MKKRLTRVLTLALSVFILLQGSALAAGAGTVIYNNALKVSDTLSYGNTASTNSNGRQESYSLSYTPGGDIQAIVSSGANIYGSSNINTVISYAQSQGYNVLGGVNSDFFSMQTGVMEGLYIENGKLMSSHHGRSAVCFLADGSAFAANPTLTFTLSNLGGSSSDNAGKSVNVSSFNKYRQAGFLYLYDSSYSSTTRTSSTGREVYFKILSGSVTVGGSVSLEVADIRNSSGGVNIDQGYILLSADLQCPYLSELDKFAVGDKVTLNISCNDSRVAEAVWATGGGDRLVIGGEKTASSGWDSTVSAANPRSAIGIKSDGSVILYAVDGRQSGYSVGLTLNDLADELLSLGCVEAVNLDGGGSTTFSYRYPGTSNITTMNRPSDGSLRSCSTYILLTSKYSGDGQPAYLYFTQNNSNVLAGSAVTASSLYSGVTAIDSGYYPASVSGLSITGYDADSSLGQQEGTAFRTSSSGGSGTLTAYTDTGAHGWLNINLITTPDSISVRAGGQSLDTLSVIDGDQVQLAYSAIYNGSTIPSSMDAYQVTTGGQAGEVDALGKYTAAGSPGDTGEITVSAGGREKTISLIIATYFADTDGHWAENNIGQMKQAGVVGGYSTELGTCFYPEQSVTRAEFAAMIIRLLGIDESGYSLTGSEFLDYDSIPQWARPYAAAMYQLGYMGGRAVAGGVNFDAEDTISRAEAFTVLGRLMETQADESILSRFADSASIPDWARGELAKLVSGGIISGYEDGTLRPLNTITRAEAVTILSRLDLAALTTSSAEEQEDSQDYEEIQPDGESPETEPEESESEQAEESEDTGLSTPEGEIAP